MHLTDSEKQSITAAIRDVESRCDAELVTVICQRSDDYYFIPTLWAALIALSFPGLLMLFDASLAYDYLWQVVVFFIAAILMQITPLKLAVIPAYIKYQRASRYAHQLFMMQGVHATNNHSGVLLFVSLDEKYAEIIADSGISQKVNNERWQVIVDNFIALVKQKKTAEAYMVTINACGELLNQYFPSTQKNANELPDHLIEIE